MNSGTSRGNARKSASDTIREALVTGIAVTVPGVVTLVVLAFVGNFVYVRLDLLAGGLTAVTGIESETAVELLTPVLFTTYLLGVGIVINRSERGERAVDVFDELVESIPIVGSIYESFRQMSDVVLDSDTQNVQAVKLVEFSGENTYTIGFLTTETPDDIRKSTDHDEMVTLFVPLAPNPVMGGHLVHVPTEQVIDTEMTVEEGVRAVVTSGVATADVEDGDGLSPNQMAELSTTQSGEAIVQEMSEREGK